MSFLDDINNRMLNNAANATGGEQPSNVSSIFDLIFPKGQTRPGILGIDDVNGLANPAEEKDIFSLFSTRKSAKVKAFLNKMLEDIKAKANEVHQMLASKSASAVPTPPQITPPAIGRDMTPSGFYNPSHGLASDGGTHSGVGHSH